MIGESVNSLSRLGGSCREFPGQRSVLGQQHTETPRTHTTDRRGNSPTDAGSCGQIGLLSVSSLAAYLEHSDIYSRRIDRWQCRENSIQTACTSMMRSTGRVNHKIQA
jgi:hypothetical protein